MTDGTEFTTRTTWGKPGDTLHLDVDPKSHPAWTGGQQHLSIAAAGFHASRRSFPAFLRNKRTEGASTASASALGAQFMRFYDGDESGLKGRRARTRPSAVRVAARPGCRQRLLIGGGACIVASSRRTSACSWSSARSVPEAWLGSSAIGFRIAGIAGCEPEPCSFPCWPVPGSFPLP